MNTSSAPLPHQTDEFFLTDGGLETTLIFHQGLDLPCFAAIGLLKDAPGRQTLKDYYRPYLELAREQGAGFILESPTWRASADWGGKLGYSVTELADLNRQAIALMRELRDEYQTPQPPIIISGCIGPRGDGYNPSTRMTPDEAEQYHLAQIQTLRDAGVDMICAMTMTHAEEAIGIVKAAKTVPLPVAISFTVETNGTLPTGQPLGEAITQVDEATGSAPAYYMINCAHPSHFKAVLASGAPWTRRIHGIRANASRKSHAELDNSTELDAGNPVELGQSYQDFLQQLPHLNVFGGCCGTDIRHLRAISKACVEALETA